MAKYITRTFTVTDVRVESIHPETKEITTQAITVPGTYEKDLQSYVNSSIPEGNIALKINIESEREVKARMEIDYFIAHAELLGD